MTPRLPGRPTKPPEIRPGQRWSTNDPRAVNKEFVVDAVDIEEGPDGLPYKVARVTYEGNGKRGSVRAVRLLTINHSRGFTYLGMKKGDQDDD